MLYLKQGKLHSLRESFPTISCNYLATDSHRWTWFGFVEFIGFVEFVELKNKATTIEVGLLLNFGRKPEFKRFVCDNKRKISA